jgi:hypothetical protein
MRVSSFGPAWYKEIFSNYEIEHVKKFVVADSLNASV